jgi:ribonuclease P protein subunit RPR2
MQKPTWQQDIAKERIEILFNLAEKQFKEYPERSKRYIQLARKIGLRYNIRFSSELKRKFCRSCNSLLVPGFTERIRTDSKTKSVARKCLKCGATHRYPYK